MNEHEIRKIVRDEFQKNYMAGNPRVARHTHDGVSNTAIPQSSIILPNFVNGTITMDTQTTYILQLTGKWPTPTSVTFYGSVFGDYITMGGFYNYHSMVTGSAQNGSNQQFNISTESSTLVTTGTITKNIIQGCAYFFYDTGLAAAISGNSQDHLIYSAYPLPDVVADIKAAANIDSISNSEIVINVGILNAGYKISGFIAIT